MYKKFVFALAATALVGLTVTPTGAAAAAGCKNGSSPHWYVFAAATSSKGAALNTAGPLGETQVKSIKRTNSPNNHKNLWLVYRGWFDSKNDANGDLSYFKSQGHSSAYIKKLCMW